METDEQKEISYGSIDTAIFAGGCFWCMEAAFQEIEGVMDVVSGYTGGNTENPTYEEVTSGTTGHYEAIQISYDPSVITYEDLLDMFWHQVDPLDAHGQFVDRGSQYRTAIFYHGETQKRLAEVSKAALEASRGFTLPVVTEILPAAEFYRAEEYHQDYYKKRTLHYQAYKKGSGRQRRLKMLWEDLE